MSKPLIAIVGRPNVGKSTLFNRLARQRIAVVEDFAGTTRDRLYADCDIWGRTCSLIDTGGFDTHDQEGYAPAIVAQAQLAIDEADIIIFVTDAREEPSTLDYEVAELLRRTRKPVILAGNKADSEREAQANLYALRLGQPVMMSAATGIGVAELTEKIEDFLPREKVEVAPEQSIPCSLVGRPNVGKSALTNKILGFERSIVSPVAGTTRDAIDTPLDWKEQRVTLIDTAGMRRKARVKAEKTSTEYHMVLRSLRAIERSDVVVLVLDSGGVAEQDTKIAGYAHEAGKAILICVNKWDVIEPERTEDRNSITAFNDRGEPKRTAAQKDFMIQIDTYLPFISYAPVHFTSAETGWNVEAMFDDALEISHNLKLRISTGVLNDTIRRAIAAHSVPSVKGRQIKIRYATQAETAPPTIIIFCSHPDKLHFSYVRFLENAIRKKFPFRGVPLKIELRKGSGEMSKEERLKVKRESILTQTLEREAEARAEKAKRRAELGIDGDDDDLDGIAEFIDDDDATVVEYTRE